MRIIKYFLLLVVIAFGVQSCSKSSLKPVTPTPPYTGPDIYVAGTATNSSTQGSVALYWKNGIVTKLTNSSLSSFAADMLINDTDKYLAGYTTDLRGYLATATFWKNGAATAIGYNDGSEGITISGNNVFVAYTGASSDGYDEPYYYTNNTNNALTPAYQDAEAEGILANGADVYVFGASTYGTDNIEATYWKNGVATQLANNNYTSSIAFAMAVQDTDVYVAGYIRTQNASAYEAVYWKNGTMVVLGSDPADADAYAIAVQGTDVYVAGAVNKKATYWKNGVVTTLSGSTLSSIALNGSDFYVAGTDNGQACYWKNGTEVKLPAVSGFTNASTTCKIIVVPQD